MYTLYSPPLASSSSCSFNKIASTSNDGHAAVIIAQLNEIQPTNLVDLVSFEERRSSKVILLY
jgi:hypothetical protein